MLIAAAVSIFTCIAAPEATSSAPDRAKCRVDIRVVDETTAETVPCRIHLKDEKGMRVRISELPFWKDHFTCPGTATLNLAPGRYSYEAERGPEFTMVSGGFSAEPAGTQVRVAGPKRLIDMAAQGWYSGDLHVHRKVPDIELLMLAEDLHVAPVITWWNERNEWKDRGAPAKPLVKFDNNRYYHLLGGEDERGGGALLYYNLDRPMAITGSAREYPPSASFLTAARQQGEVHVDIEKPFWWDVPIWLASGKVDTIGIANNHMCRSEMHEDEAWGRPRDVNRLPAPLGNGYWSQEIYYHVLNAGLRLPPSAGSASGVLPNPVGYNRVYVHVDGDLTYKKWFEALRAGRSFVTNGPLLRVTANNKLPGQVFSAPAGESLELEIRAEITARDAIRAIEVVRDGRVEHRIAQLPPTGVVGRLKFSSSGWFLVRAMVDNSRTFRFASSAPFHVEIGTDRQRVSRSSVQFFLDWLDRRQESLQLADPAQRQEVQASLDSAKVFWRGLLAGANSD